MLLKVFLRDGETLTIDLLSDPDSWKRRQVDRDFQRRISALGLQHGKVLHVLPAPSRFQAISYSAEIIFRKDGGAVAARAGCVADEVLASMTVYYNGNPPMVRMDLKRLGKARWAPPTRMLPQRRED